MIFQLKTIKLDQILLIKNCVTALILNHTKINEVLTSYFQNFKFLVIKRKLSKNDDIICTKILNFMVAKYYFDFPALKSFKSSPKKYQGNKQKI